jgi:hypothetical protein
MIDLIKESLSYDPETGAFTRLKNQGCCYSGRVGYVDKRTGYCYISVCGRRYTAHRLAFVLMNGSFPKGLVDHINRNSSDNRWCNLRDTTQHVNQMNCGLRRNNKSGARGVCWSNKEQKWVLYVRMGGVKKRIGCYKFLQDAKNASDEIYSTLII